MDVDLLRSFLTDVVLTPWGLGILGLCVGSFLNVVIHRMPQVMEQQWQAEARSVLGLPDAEPVAKAEPASEGAPALSLSKPASRCPSCGHAIRWYENIPVISWLALRGKCSSCGTRISLRYPFIELATAALFAACAWRFGNQPTTLLWCGFVAALVAASAIDWDTTILPIVLGSSIIGAVIGIGMKLSSQLREGVYVPYGPFLAGAGLVVALAGSARVLNWLGWA